MKYVITGASGFLGVDICKELLRQGHQINAVCRKESKGLDNLPKNDRLSVVWADLNHLNDILSQVDSADVFIHLAWQGTVSGGRFNPELQAENVQNALTAMRVASKIGCKLFVDAGSQAEYGTVTETITEETPCNPFSDYGKAKLQVWNEGKELCKELGLKYIHLRIFSVYGENDHPYTLVMSLIQKMLKNEPMDLSPCTQNWNYIYSEDAAKLVVGLCNYANSEQGFVAEVYNIASDDTRLLKDFVERMKELTHSTSTLKYGAIAPANYVSLQPSINKTMKAANIQFTPFDNVIRKIINKNSQL
jgi:nucleoside-diphosphate-sugar epimerase